MTGRSSHFWPAARLWAVNAFIAAVLGLILLDGLPFVPPRIRGAIDPVVDKVGIWQAGWNMFAPTVDTANSRYSADIEYADGTIAHWNSPDWRNQSPWQRFIDSRYFEYLDNVALELNIDAWPALADHIARVHPGPRPSAKLRRVTIWGETSGIDDPQVWGWHPRSAQYPYGKRYLFYEQEYP
jgi:hypothetical protein